MTLKRNLMREKTKKSKNLSSLKRVKVHGALIRGLEKRISA